MSIRDEFDGAELGDPRLLERLLRVAERLDAEPAKSVASAMPTVAEREAAYRLLANEAVEFREVLEPHLARTAARVEAIAGEVVVAHDTTEVGYSTPRKGLGRVNDEEMGRGFFLHAALAVSADARREPLGILGAQEYRRLKGPPKTKRKHSEEIRDDKKESARWWELASEVATRC